jgi:hypothetical protein
MALRFGKKKDNADDWSDDSLRQELAQISGEPADNTEPLAAAAEDAGALDDFSDFGDFPETPEAAAPAAPIPSPAVLPSVATDGATEVTTVPRTRPRISPVLLAGGLVFLVVAIAVGVYLAFFSSPTEDDSAPPVPAPRVAEVAPPAPAPGGPLPATKTLSTKTAPPTTVTTKTTVKVPATKTVPPRIPVKVVPAGKAGIAPKAGSAPGIAPPTPGQAPRVVPVKGVPTPVGPPPGMAGIPGKGSTRTTTVQVVPPPGQPLTPALQAQLKALWKKGADAKHRGDLAGARSAWQQMLRLHPGHAGVQEAIDKLR